MTKGVLIAADKREQWLLPWWWDSYTRTNNYPVTFVDWGMSESSKEWCRKRGTLVSFSLDPALKDAQLKINSVVRHAIELFDAPFLTYSRPYWFSKPQIMSRTPYDTTLWIDLDCEILTSLEGLFAYAEAPAGVAIARDTEINEKRNRELGLLDEEGVLYNSGVIAFKKDSSLIKDWAELCLSRHEEFLGDQNVLSHLIHLNNSAIWELPEVYNWRISRGLHFNAKIIHWAGSWGKTFIKKHGGLKGIINPTYALPSLKRAVR